jgi:mannose-1-phosphate guanylyltransferase
MSRADDYTGYGWIKVKRLAQEEYEGEKFYSPPDRPTQESYHSSGYVYWLEERLAELEEHHVDETTFLIDEVRKLAKEVDDAKGGAS